MIETMIEYIKTVSALRDTVTETLSNPLERCAFAQAIIDEIVEDYELDFDKLVKDWKKVRSGYEK